MALPAWLHSWLASQELTASSACLPPAAASACLPASSCLPACCQPPSLPLPACLALLLPTHPALPASSLPCLPPCQPLACPGCQPPSPSLPHHAAGWLPWPAGLPCPAAALATLLLLLLLTTSFAQHGQGYSRFEQVSHRISLELLQYVAPDDPIKISRLKIVNQSSRSRRLSITAYVEWLSLGASRAASAPFIVTEIDPETNAMFARNHWSTGFGTRVAFADLRGDQRSVDRRPTGISRRNGTLDCPAALPRRQISPNKSVADSTHAAQCRRKDGLAAGEIRLHLFWARRRQKPKRFL